MLKSLLAASDLSSRSRPAVLRAMQLAKHFAARAGVLHVVEDDQPDARMREEMRSAEAFLETQLKEFEGPPGCEVYTRSGDAFRVIVDEAEARDADLIVLGAHRRQFLRDIFVGTTIERVTRTAGRPVLMANAEGVERWKKILIAVDMSESSGRAARVALELGLLEGAEVTFVHVYTPVTGKMMAFAGISSDRIREEASREFETTWHEMASFIRELDLGELEYQVRLIEGLGPGAILGLAEQAGSDLLVMGTRGLSGVKQVLLGSVAQELMNSATIDVLAVPPRR